MFHNGRNYLVFAYVRTGLDDPTLLPNYSYRDDALDLWNATKAYVSNVVMHFYKCDAVSSNVFSINLLMDYGFTYGELCCFFDYAITLQRWLQRKTSWFAFHAFVSAKLREALWKCLHEIGKEWKRR